MELTIKKAEEKHWEGIKKIAKEVQEAHRKNRPEIFAKVQPYSNLFFEAMQKEEENDLFVVCDKKETVYAYCICSVHFYTDLSMFRKRKILMLDDFCVAEKHKREGIGAMLFQFIRKRKAEQQVDGIELNVWYFNQEAKLFFEKMGMTRKSLEYEIDLTKEPQHENYHFTSKTNG